MVSKLKCAAAFKINYFYFILFTYLKMQNQTVFINSFLGAVKHLFL